MTKIQLVTHKLSPQPLPRPSSTTNPDTPLLRSNNSMKNTKGESTAGPLSSLLLRSQNCCRLALLPSRGEREELVPVNYVQFHTFQKYTVKNDN